MVVKTLGYHHAHEADQLACLVAFTDDCPCGRLGVGTGARYWQRQLAELQAHVGAIESSRVAVTAVLYDSPADLARFTGKHNITFPILSNEDSEIITTLGLLNTDMADGTTYYGVPYPGVFLLDSDSRIVAKYAEQDDQVRPLIADVLVGVNALTH